MKTIRELMVEFILFSVDEDVLLSEYALTPGEVNDLSDIDILELYDKTLLSV